MRSRLVSSEFWQSEDVAALEPLQRLIWIGIWGAASEEGVGKANPRLLAAELFPYDDIAIMSATIANTLVDLAELGMIFFYRENREKYPKGNRENRENRTKPNIGVSKSVIYYNIQNFDRYQTLRPSKTPRYPLPTSKGVEIISVQEFVQHLHTNANKCMQMYTNVVLREGKGREGKGREYNLPAKKIFRGSFHDTPDNEQPEPDNQPDNEQLEQIETIETIEPSTLEPEPELQATTPAREPARARRVTASKNTNLRAYAPEFEQFWKTYPHHRRKEKPSAFRAFLDALERASLDDIMRGLEKMNEGDTAFAPYPAKWLKNDSWNDFQDEPDKVLGQDTKNDSRPLYYRVTGIFADKARQLLQKIDMPLEQKFEIFEGLLDQLINNPEDTTQAVKYLQEKTREYQQ